MHRSPWPTTATRRDGELVVGGVPAPELARRFGTPLWVVDEDDLRARCRAWQEAFTGATVAYAAKAWPTTGILQIVTGEGLWLDVASGGELHTAAEAGVDPARIILHGSNKSDDELERALELGVGRIAVDNLGELDRLGQLAGHRGVVAPVWLRITPGIDAHTHEYVRTGHDDTQFGLTLSLGLADEALERALASEHVDVLGVHAHIGSQVLGTDPFVANATVMVELLARWRDEHGVALGELDLGGGMGVRYTHEDVPAPVEAHGRAVREAVRDACRGHGLEPPALFVEPGRAIVAPSTVTLYTVGTVKDLAGIRTYVSVDGGMSDNPRPALYDATHEVAVADRSQQDADLEPVAVVGKHCESGDVLRERAPLPADLAPGALLAVAATGAYTEAMASNYNRLPRPAAVLVRDGRARELIRRETLDDLLRRDVALE